MLLQVHDPPIDIVWIPSHSKTVGQHLPIDYITPSTATATASAHNTEINTSFAIDLPTHQALQEAAVHPQDENLFRTTNRTGLHN